MVLINDTRNKDNRVNFPLQKKPSKIDPGPSLTSTLSAADLATETGLDGGDGTAGAAGVAGDEVQTVLALVELGVGAAAGFAGNVLDCNLLGCNHAAILS